MFIIDGKRVYAYMLHTPTGPILGFDAEPIDVIEKRWLAAWRAGSADMVRQEVEANRIEALNSRTLKEVIDPKESFGERPKPGDLELRAPPTVTPSAAAVLRLNGFPKAAAVEGDSAAEPTLAGYGSVSVLAEQVRAIAYVDTRDIAMLRGPTPALGALSRFVPAEATQVPAAANGG